MRPNRASLDSNGKTYHYSGFKILVPFKSDTRNPNPILSRRLEMEPIEVLLKISECIWPEGENHINPNPNSLSDNFMNFNFRPLYFH